jgi:hypothetical protein
MVVFLWVRWLSLVLGAAGSALGSSPPPPATADTASADVCTINFQMADPGDCPSYGPGAQQLQLRQLGLVPERPLPILSWDASLVQAANLSYHALGKDRELKIYPTVADALAKAAAQVFHKGFVYISVQDQITKDRNVLYVTPSGIVRQDEVGAKVTPSGFHGLEWSLTPSRTFGWVVESTFASPQPGAQVDKSLPWLGRYTPVQVYATEPANGLDWYLVGVGQWLDQKKVALVVPDGQPPTGVPADSRWIRVNLYEQTLAAYDQGKLVFATLTASGLPPWYTRPGLFQVYKKLDLTPMSGAFTADFSDYYYLQDVPWVMYYDRARALHGTYWHDGFGYMHSHGCVNLSIADAHWLYNWTTIGTFVQVYDPSGRTPTAASFYSNDAGY